GIVPPIAEVTYAVDPLTGEPARAWVAPAWCDQRYTGHLIELDRPDLAIESYRKAVAARLSQPLLGMAERLKLAISDVAEYRLGLQRRVEALRFFGKVEVGQLQATLRDETGDLLRDVIPRLVEAEVAIGRLEQPM
ncbi:MAG TPA: hypothetical protein VI322_02595, partial [Candidatus Saccharimonadia bacterium]